AREARLKYEEGVSSRIDLGARLGPALTACIGVTARGVWASHVMHKVSGGGRPRRDDGDSSNVAQAYRPIEAAKNRFQSCRRLRCGGPLDLTVWRRGIESRFSARSMALPRLVEVVEARGSSSILLTSAGRFSNTTVGSSSSTT
ncbi:MAG: hypothetical protein ABSA14_09220, partial [Acidimicrobiales bacterium]